MVTRSSILEHYEKIQKQLFYMIPEKWDRVYLYASVVDHFKEVQTGEMFFYYFPKSMIRKSPINVYEIPLKFNIDEHDYLKLAEKLYSEIKLLRKDMINIGEKAWSNVTIWAKDFKFNVEYNYENLQQSKYTNDDRHLIWRYEYLGIPLSSYSKKEKKMIEEYLEEKQHKVNKKSTYQEAIYETTVSNITEYNKQEEEKNINENSDINMGERLKSTHNSTKKDEEEQTGTIKSQILITN